MRINLKLTEQWFSVMSMNIVNGRHSMTINMANFPFPPRLVKQPCEIWGNAIHLACSIVSTRTVIQLGKSSHCRYSEPTLFSSRDCHPWNAITLGKKKKKKRLITYYERWSKLFNSVACTNFICLVAKIVWIKRVQIKLLLLLLLVVVSSSSSSWSSCCCFCCCWQWWDSEVAYRWLARG